MIDNALEALAQYRAEGVVLTNALERLSGESATLSDMVRALRTDDPDALARGFIALREHLAQTRVAIDPAIDFLDKAIEELGHEPPYRGKAGALRDVAEERS